jgi:S-adenosylmethionine:tRNA ribosyltransferase-isomerase
VTVYELDAYDYPLPESQIAQAPAEPRDSARLLVWDVESGLREHRVFRDFPELLNAGDLLVLNDTRVLPARLYGRGKKSGGNVEILLLSPVESDFCLWRALIRPGRRLRKGAEALVGERVLTIEGLEAEGVRLVRVGAGREDVLAFLDQHGQMPLPPYIRGTDPLRAREAYQTVFARKEGSAAAPTASLHFTEGVLTQIRERGVAIAWTTLHVGLGTFRPVKTRDIREHHIHGEWCQVPKATEVAVRECRARRGRVVAAGTTVARTLESMAVERGFIRAGAMETRLFIYPGFSFQVVDALLTNFHLPRSSLLMLAAAFAHNRRGGQEALAALQETYSLAVAEGYRFFSFGDAMFMK